MFFTKAASQSLSETPKAAPIYLAGCSPLAIFLAFRLQKQGHRVILLDSPRNLQTFDAADVVIKEERTLRSHHLRFETAYSLDETPQLLIIATETNNLRSTLTLLPPRRLKNIPIISLTLPGRHNLLAKYLGTPYVQGYFSGWLMYDKHQLSIMGFQTSLQLGLEESDRRTVFIRNLFNGTEIEIETVPDSKQNFWHYFIPYAAASLLSAAYEKNIFNFTKKETERRLIDECLKELIEIAAINGTTVEYADVLRRIYATPSAYLYPLQLEISHRNPACLSTLSSLLLGYCGTNGKFPQIRALLKSLSDKILA